MVTLIDRKVNAMKRLVGSLFSLLALSFQVSASPPREGVPAHPPTDAYEGWRLAVQAWTFNRFTFTETVEKAASAGLRWIEAYPGQQVRKDDKNAKMGPALSAGDRAAVKKMLEDAGIGLVNFGVVDLPNDESACRRVFDFARDMGIETIVSEPPREAFDLVERLCAEYKIKVALHNHPTPSPYWNPETILEVCKGRSTWIGACADVGHWLRSGIDPLEALKKLKGRITLLHFKDLNRRGDPEAHDVVWGTGVANVGALLKELDAQKFRGVFSIEYEHHWENSLPEVRSCIAAFERIAGSLKPGGWKKLIADDLTNCLFPPGSWMMQDGVLQPKGGGDIWTKERYGDFVLDLEFKLDTNTNSGVFLRTGDIKEWLHTAIEVQVLDSYGKKDVGREDCGAIFDCMAPSMNAVKAPGEWNRYTITCRGNTITVVLNGHQIISMDLDRWREAHRNPDGTPNKFNTAYKDMPRSGNIGLQYHGHPVWYRNLRILVSG
jgi:sugar phosphate isomerase/epimerase